MVTPQVLREKVLRSINVRYDASYPERIAHFRPTGKTVQLLRALLGLGDERAFFVVAPYGSGKSLTASYTLQIVENRPEAQEVLEVIEGKLSAVSPSIQQFSMERRSSEQKGLVLVLEGHCDELHHSLKDALCKALVRNQHEDSLDWVAEQECEGMGQVLSMLRQLSKRLEKRGVDRFVLLWDEFGRHLESLMAKGRATELNQIQQLAEFVSRATRVPFVLGLLLHQQLLQYAGSLSQVAMAEWKKIEGRFETIHYVDDSKELYRLLGELIEDYSPGCPLSSEQISAAVLSCLELGLFREFSTDEEELKELLRMAYPFEPTALAFLPKVAARVAQNERTLFTFLQSIDFSQRVTLSSLYAYFSPAMQADTAVGGTYRRWIETESALSKLIEEPELSSEALKTACLLSLGIHGERSRAKRGLLEFALRGYDPDGTENEVIDSLIARKLLLHRKHNNEVAVWHGTDIDLRSRLNEEMLRHPLEALDLVKFLNVQARPSVWRPVRYNSDHNIHRFFVGGYADMAMLVENLGLFNEEKTVEEEHGDGFICYIITSTLKELQEAEAWVSQPMQSAYETRLVVLPNEPIPLARAALEVKCLMEMQHDEELLSQDPLLSKELHHMLDDSRMHLQRLIDRLVRPGSPDARWFYKGQEQSIPNALKLREFLSTIMEEVFSKTPKINNELIVRNNPSRPMVNARKKLLMGILERYGQPDLGLEGFTPDASMFRTVLLHTRLYRKDKRGRWKFYQPDRIEDPGLRTVWRKFKTLFTEPSSGPKDIGKFIEELSSPPYGVRQGLFPILFAASFKAFPSTLALLREGEYVDDLLPSDIELLCSEPKRFEFRVLECHPSTLDYLQKVYHCFSQRKVNWGASDFIRVCHEAMEEWKARLPEAAFNSNRISASAKRLRQAFRRTANPVSFLFQEIPWICELPVPTFKQQIEEGELEAFQIFVDAVAELEGIVELYQADAAAELIPVFSPTHQGSLLEAAESWLSSFPKEFIQGLEPGVEKNVLIRIGMNYDEDGKLVESLAGLLLKRSTKRWDDATIKEFVRATKDVVLRAEEEAFKQNSILPQDHDSKEKLTEIIRSRMGELMERMLQVMEPQEAKEELLSLLSEITSK